MEVGVKTVQAAPREVQILAICATWSTADVSEQRLIDAGADIDRITMCS